MATIWILLDGVDGVDRVDGVDEVDGVDGEQIITVGTILHKVARVDGDFYELKYKNCSLYNKIILKFNVNII